MKVNSVLELNKHKSDEAQRVASWLRAHDFEVKVSSTTDKIYVATNALMRTLRKARKETSIASLGVNAMLAMCASVGGK